MVKKSQINPERHITSKFRQINFSFVRMKSKFYFGLIFISILCICVTSFAQETEQTIFSDIPLETNTMEDTTRMSGLADSLSELRRQKANTDSLIVLEKKQIDSIRLIDKMHLNPKKAGLYSALIPGGGQVYNKEYWKIPIVYAAIGTGVGFIIYNQKNYNSARLEYSKRLSLRTDLNERYAMYNMYMLQQEQDYFKENLDLSVLLTSLGYILQIMDAVAFNHLKGFDISPDISMRFKVSDLPYNQVGLGMAFSFK